LEVQYAPEHVIAAVEKNGGIITTAFYDVMSLQAAVDPEAFFKRVIFFFYFFILKWETPDNL